ncbi:hypothetical protein BDN71DRAFT_1432850 [Pleurotus eryngii]|uniref:Uncharacterized protein n=1 Tax=Pleurotus eryngii TaxID=5323 RepID=A0A9P6D506_PLEER|nr:hypothetical protein BDN71DRAFT_1432850 [Pleurotus eryngii]
MGMRHRIRPSIKQRSDVCHWPVDDCMDNEHKQTREIQELTYSYSSLLWDFHTIRQVLLMLYNYWLLYTSDGDRGGQGVSVVMTKKQVKGGQGVGLRCEGVSNARWGIGEGRGIAWCCSGSVGGKARGWGMMVVWKEKVVCQHGTPELHVCGIALIAENKHPSKNKKEKEKEY